MSGSPKLAYTAGESGRCSLCGRSGRSWNRRGGDLAEAGWISVWPCGIPQNDYMGMDQYLLIPFLGGWTSIYQLFWCELQGYKVLTHCHMKEFDNPTCQLFLSTKQMWHEMGWERQERWRTRWKTDCVKELWATELSVTELCVKELYVTELGVKDVWWERNMCEGEWRSIRLPNGYAMIQAYVSVNM